MHCRIKHVTVIGHGEAWSHTINGALRWIVDRKRTEKLIRLSRQLPKDNLFYNDGKQWCSWR